MGLTWKPGIQSIRASFGRIASSFRTFLTVSEKNVRAKFWNDPEMKLKYAVLSVKNKTLVVPTQNIGSGRVILDQIRRG